MPKAKSNTSRQRRSAVRSTTVANTNESLRRENSRANEHIQHLNQRLDEQRLCLIFQSLRVSARDNRISARDYRISDLEARLDATGKSEERVKDELDQAVAEICKLRDQNKVLAQKSKDLSNQLETTMTAALDNAELARQAGRTLKSLAAKSPDMKLNVTQAMQRHGILVATRTGESHL